MLVPIVQQPGQRDGTVLTKDALMENCYQETDGDRTLVVKRPGPAPLHTLTATLARGITYWNDEVISIFGARLFRGSISITASIAGTGQVYFESTAGGADVSGTAIESYLVMSDGTNAYYMAPSWTVVTITGGASATAMGVHVPRICHLDGYLFNFKVNGDIQHTDQYKPASWPALNLINAESDPDRGVGLARHMNYLAALGEKSVEFFYDAGNATGSVLSRVDGAKLPFGCANGTTIADVFGSLIWVTQDRQVMMVETMKPAFISTAPVTRMLKGATLTDARAFPFQIQGHVFYVLTLPTTNVTLVYDLREQKWQRFTDSSGNFWPYVAAHQAAANATIYMQHISTGVVCTLPAATWQDEGADYTVKIRSQNTDFGKAEPKTLRSMQYLGDRGTGPINLRYSDDDYANWSATRSVSLSYPRPKFWALGRFTQRAFEISFRSNESLRIYAFDFDLA